MAILELSVPQAGLVMPTPRWKKTTIVAVVVLSVGVWGLSPTIQCYRHKHYVLDGTASCFLPILFRENTQYAPGYTNAAFQKVRLGMTEDEVKALLGPPLNKWKAPGGGESMSWSKSPGESAYRIRTVMFVDGRVARIFNEFYVD